MKKPESAKLIGRYIVSDPRICHGKPTFKGTRVLVSDVLDQVGNGMAWETIIEDWNRSLTREAIREAVSLDENDLSRIPLCDVMSKPVLD